MQVVDIHPHIVSRDTDRYPVSPLLGQRSNWSEDHSVDLAELIGAMDQAGVAKAAVVHSSTTYGFDCDYVADATAQHPDRLTGVFSVNVLESDAPAQMLKWLGRGLTGMRIYSRGTTFKDAWLTLDDPRIFPCYELAIEKNISIASNVDELAEVDKVMSRFPDLVFVLDHVGRTEFDDEPFDNARPLFELARHKNLHLKVTTRNIERAKRGNSSPQAMFQRLVAEFGADRIAWGSNYPASKGTLESMVIRLKEGISTLSRTDQEWIAGGTARKIYGALGR